MDAACIAWDTSPPFSFPSLLSSSFFPLFPPTRPLSPPRRTLRSVFVPFPCCPASLFSTAVVLLCCLLCLVVPALLRARVGFLCAFFPPPSPPSFLCSACLLCAPPACCLPLLFAPLVSPLFVVAGCPCSLPSPPPTLLCVCVCETPRILTILKQC